MSRQLSFSARKRNSLMESHLAQGRSQEMSTARQLARTTKSMNSRITNVRRHDVGPQSPCVLELGIIWVLAFTHRLYWWHNFPQHRQRQKRKAEVFVITLMPGPQWPWATEMPPSQQVIHAWLVCSSANASKGRNWNCDRCCWCSLIRNPSKILEFQNNDSNLLEEHHFHYCFVEKINYFLSICTANGTRLNSIRWGRLIFWHHSISACPFILLLLLLFEQASNRCMDGHDWGIPEGVLDRMVLSYLW